MADHGTEWAALAARVDKLERHNRWLRRAGLMVLVVAGTGLVAAAQQRREQVIADRIALRDENGKVRAELVMDKGAPRLQMYDADDKVRLRATVNKGPALILLDEEEADRVVIGYTKERGGAMDLYDADKNQLVGLRAHANGQGLVLFDDKGRARVGLVHTKKGPRFDLMDEDGQPILTLPPPPKKEG